MVKLSGKIIGVRTTRTQRVSQQQQQASYISPEQKQAKQLAQEKASAIQNLQNQRNIVQEKLDNINRQLAEYKRTGVSKEQKSNFYDLEDKKTEAINELNTIEWGIAKIEEGKDYNVVQQEVEYKSAKFVQAKEDAQKFKQKYGITKQQAQFQQQQFKLANIENRKRFDELAKAQEDLTGTGDVGTPEEQYQDLLKSRSGEAYVDFISVTKPSYFDTKVTTSTQKRTDFYPVTYTKTITKKDFLADTLNLKEVEYPSYYATKSTINKTPQPRKEFIPANIGYEEIGFVDWTRSKIPDFYLNVPTKLSYKSLVGIPNLITTFPVTEGAVKINLREFEVSRMKKLGEQSAKLDVAKIESLGIKEQIDTQAQREYETRFYRGEYGRQAFLGEMEFEKATEKFSKTDEAKIIQAKYSSEIKLKIKETTSLKDVLSMNYLKGLGIEGEKLFWTVTPTTPEGLAVESLAFSKVTQVGKLIPSYVMNTGTLGIGTYGLSKVFTGETLSAKASGGITAGISFGILGYQGVKYLRKPTVKTSAITQKDISVRASETIGKDVKLITKQGEINRVIFNNQKLSQDIVAGRRTIVSTKWRDLLGFDPIYKGVPYAQPSQSAYIEGLGSGGYYSDFYKTKSGYQKAMELLVKRGGYTPYQATQTLRYYQPKMIEQYLQRGILTISEGKATGEFLVQTKQPVINIDSSLGIKTRGARTIEDAYKVERKLIELKSGQTGFAEIKTKLSYYLERGATPFKFKDLSVSKAITIGKASETYTGFEPIKTGVKELKTFKQVTVKDLFGVTTSKNIYPRDNIINIDFTKTKLINKIIDLREPTGFGTPSTIKKTPFAKTFVTETKIDNLKEIIKGTGTATATKSATKTATDIQAILKTSAVPVQSDFTKVNIKEITNILQGSNTIATSGLLLSTSNLLKSATKLDLGLELGLKGETTLKEDIIYKQAQTPQQATTLRTSQITQLMQVPITTFRTPTFREPILPIKPVKPSFPVWFDFPSAKGKGKKKKKKGLVQEYAYLPDFTSRALGLEAEELTEKQAQKRLSKLLTGLEIRRGVKIRR